MTLGKEKLAGVRQKLTILSPDTSDIGAFEEDGGLEATYDRMSDAEQVILLHRDTRRIQLAAEEPKKIQ